MHARAFSRLRSPESPASGMASPTVDESSPLSLPCQDSTLQAHLPGDSPFCQVGNINHHTRSLHVTPKRSPSPGLHFLVFDNETEQAEYAGGRGKG